jgi:NAD(P)H-hydrate epimerase
MVLTCAQMKSVEEAAFARGVSAERLMESAGLAIARAALDFLPSPGRATAVCGKGNNAGDVLVAARHLAARGWAVELDLAYPESEFSPLAARKFAELSERRPSRPAPTDFPASHLVLDGLLGLGAHGSPREPIASAIRRIHALRDRGAFVLAADLPSGLEGDSGVAGDPCVIADLTVTIGHAKIGLLADGAANFVGRLALAPLPELATETGDPAELAAPDLLRPLLPPRPFDSHKGTWGRVGLVAGSRGFLGAARLCSEAALRAGAGLVTLYVLPDIYELLATTVTPEVMVKPVSDYRALLDDRLDAVGIGPGLGHDHGDAILEIIGKVESPMVVDADALNLLARRSGAWPNFQGPRLFTPHPGEMDRLFPEGKALSRREIAERYSARHPITLLLKGARTIIAGRDHPIVYNTTGNPGMGSGGMGDVLTGVCAGLMAGKHSPRHAAMLGAWLCGRAAEMTVYSAGGSPESLAATDVIHHLGAAFQELRHPGLETFAP